MAGHVGVRERPAYAEGYGGFIRRRALLLPEYPQGSAGRANEQSLAAHRAHGGCPRELRHVVVRTPERIAGSHGPEPPLDLESQGIPFATPA